MFPYALHDTWHLAKKGRLHGISPHDMEFKSLPASFCIIYSPLRNMLVSSNLTGVFKAYSCFSCQPLTKVEIFLMRSSGNAGISCLLATWEYKAKKWAGCLHRSIISDLLISGSLSNISIIRPPIK